MSEKEYAEIPLFSETDIIKEQAKKIEQFQHDHQIMSKVLEMYKEIPLPDVFGDPYYFANQALERRKLKA